MSFIVPWRNFKRMEDLTAAAAALIYAAALLRAFERRPGGDLIEATLVWPALHLALALLVPTRWPLLRRLLLRYVWMSFCAGFGQTVASVLVGASLMAAVAFMIFREVAAAGDALSLAPMFSAFAAGVGILAAQALMVRALERQPEVRAVIEAR